MLKNRMRFQSATFKIYHAYDSYSMNFRKEDHRPDQREPD